jgi:alkanesulfonate monooxygenase SsuD/methylene tetrahydromethanopterin reductase-like flavin-dependent oxidoreductase (luciferase family)
MTGHGAACVPQVPPERIPEVARAAEAAGLDEMWVWEDCFWVSGTSGVVAALAATERISVGVSLLPVPLRNVALTAMEITTLHRLFPGRVTVAVGHGAQDWMAQAGARPESPMTLLREYLIALKALLRGETVTTSGRYVRLDRVTLDWTATPVPAVYLGGVGAKTLRLAGELADGVVLDDASKFRTALEIVTEGAAGRTSRPKVVGYVDAAPAETAQQVAARVHDLARGGADTVLLAPRDRRADPLAFMEFAARAFRASTAIG